MPSCGQVKGQLIEVGGEVAFARACGLDAEGERSSAGRAVSAEEAGLSVDDLM